NYDIINTFIKDNDNMWANNSRPLRNIIDSKIIHTGLVDFTATGITESAFEDCYSTMPGTSIVVTKEIKKSVFMNAKVSDDYYIQPIGVMTNSHVEGFKTGVFAVAGMQKNRISNNTFINNGTALTLISSNKEMNVITCNWIKQNDIGIRCNSPQRD